MSFTEIRFCTLFLYLKRHLAAILREYVPNLWAEREYVLVVCFSLRLGTLERKKGILWAEE